jgi:putative Holliday junction resolvase
MPRILAIDFGTKRIGIAVTDPLQLIANPLQTIESNQILPFLEDYLKREVVEAIVVGDPKSMDGSPSGPVEALHNFMIALNRKFPVIRIERVDERFTSKLAMSALLTAGASRKQRANKGNIDKLSAVIILQTYMDAQNARK